MNAAEVEKQFRAELAALLKRWGAEIEVDDHYNGHAGCGMDLRATVTIDAIYNADNECEREGADFDLGTYITGGGE